MSTNHTNYDALIGKQLMVYRNGLRLGRVITIDAGPRIGLRKVRLASPSYEGRRDDGTKIWAYNGERFSVPGRDAMAKGCGVYYRKKVVPIPEFLNTQIPLADGQQGPGAPEDATGESAMKKNEVHIGGEYLAKVTGNVVPVRLDAENRNGGWDATNLKTNKKIRIKSAQRLRGKAMSKDIIKAMVAADQENARARDERAASTDAQTASERAMAKSAAKKDKTTTIDAGEKAATAKKHVSCLDAAAQVLKAKGEPMNTKDLIDAMASQGLWKSDKATPAATLYSAIIREIGVKKNESRFKKVERGQFALTA